MFAALIARVPGSFHQVFDPDETTIAAQAITLNSGGTLYVDAIDRKPPLPVLAYQLVFQAVGEPDLRFVHLLAAGLFAVAAVLIALDPGFSTRRERLTAGLLFIATASAMLPDGAQAANYAHFALAPGAGAIVLARRRGWLPAIASGACLGVAILCRQTWVIGVLPAAVAIWRNGRPKHLAPFLIGLGLPFAAVFEVVSPRAFWHWDFSSNEGFIASAPDWSMAVGSFAWNALLIAIFHIGLIALVVAAGHDGALARRARANPDLILWLCGAMIAWASGLRFFSHYALQAAPPLAIFLAPLLTNLRVRRRLVQAAIAVPAVLAVTMAFAPSMFRTLPNVEPVAAYVDTHTGAGDRVLVWGNLPELLWKSERPIGGALVISDFAVGLSGNRKADAASLEHATPGAQEALLDSIRQHPPVLIIDTSTADIRQYAAYPLSSVADLKHIVDTDYRPVALVDGITVYRRNLAAQGMGEEELGPDADQIATTTMATAVSAIPASTSTT